MIPGNPLRSLSISLALALALALPVRGEELDLPPAAAVQSERPLLNLELPVRGMSMEQVEQRFGVPLEKVPAVGAPRHPPITRWVYQGFTVYFEYRHVVHAVLNRRTIRP